MPTKKAKRRRKVPARKASAAASTAIVHEAEAAAPLWTVPESAPSLGWVRNGWFWVLYVVILAGVYSVLLTSRSNGSITGSYAGDFAYLFFLLIALAPGVLLFLSLMGSGVLNAGSLLNFGTYAAILVSLVATAVITLSLLNTEKHRRLLRSFAAFWIVYLFFSFLYTYLLYFSYIQYYLH